MLNAKDPQAINTIDRILECAVFLNWRDFASGSSPTAVRLEYRTGPTSLLKCLKLWSSISPGHWKLVCEYWMEPNSSHQQGVMFTKTYSSPGLTRLLDAIMHHQEMFSVASTDLRNCVVQTPDVAQCTAAKRDMTEALERITLRNSSGAASVAMRLAADHPSVPASVISRHIN